MLSLPPANKTSTGRTLKPKGRKVKTLPPDVLWQGGPSLVLALGKLNLAMLSLIVFIYYWGWRGEIAHWLLAVLTVLTVYSLFSWAIKALQIKCTSYTVTYERIIVKTGVFSREINELELFRVRDFQVQAPFHLRIWGLGNVALVSSDRTHPFFAMLAVPECERLHSMLRKQVRACWANRGVYEIDSG